MNEFQQRETGETGERDRSAQEIEREIEATRDRMSHNIDELGERLSPSSLKEQARDAISGAAHNAASNVADRARRTGSRMADAFRDNAIPVTMVGVGVTWMLLKRGTDSDRRFTYTGPERRAGYSGYGSAGYGTAGYAPGTLASGWSEYAGGTEEEESRVRRTADSVRDKLGNAAHSTRDKVSGAAHSVGDSVSNAASSVRSRTGDFARRASDLGSDAKHKAQDLGHRVKGGFDDTIESNPLAIAAGATLLGLAIGLMFPSTERENRLMGETRDRVMDTARETAREVKEVATESARDEVNERGDELKQTAREVVEKVKDSASRVAEETGEAARDTARETIRSKKA
ncbi:MAG TPA: DUF3618 domain-containing protein [Gemmatimonadales bacterium]|nr:DUF3618 domain-containing protein [Gemmatimonadales bacterium]